MRRHSGHGHLTSKVEHLLGAVTREVPLKVDAPRDHRMAARLSRHDHADIITSHVSGEGIKSLSRRLRISEYSIRMVLAPAGRIEVSHGLSSIELDAACKLYELGVSAQAVARRFGVAQSTARLVFATQGLRRSSASSVSR